MKSLTAKSIVALGVATAAAVAAGGCSSSKTGRTPIGAERSGSAVVEVVIPGGFNVATIQAVISGPTAKTLSVDVSQGLGRPQADGTVAIDLGTTTGLPPGSHTVTISGVSTDGSVPCAGSAAPFSVTANAIAMVTVFASCRTRAPDGGSAAISGDFYDCGRVDSLSDSVGEAMVGQSIPITGSVSGLNPAALKWSFSLSDADGTFAPLTGSGPSASTTFTCTRPGTVTISLSAHDGAIPLDSSGCGDIDSKSITVVCDL